MDPDQIEQMPPPELPPAVAAVIFGIFAIFFLFMIISMWKVFKKADEPGWACLIPIYNGMIFCKIAGKPLWWIFLMFIPGLGIIWAIMATISFAEKFGKGGGYAVGLIILPIVFYPMLAFGNATYIGPKTA